MRNTGPGLAALLVDQRLDEVDDVLLARGGGVEFPAHFDEAAVNLLETLIDMIETLIDLIETLIDLLETPIDMIAQVDEVLPESVETRSRCLAEVADLGSDLADVAVGRTGEHPGCRGILLDGAESPADVAEIIVTHTGERTPRVP